MATLSASPRENSREGWFVSNSRNSLAATSLSSLSSCSIATIVSKERPTLRRSHVIGDFATYRYSLP